MTHLSLSLLGPLEISLDGTPVAAFESDKVRALLIYLAVEAHQPHRRESLVGLFWAERPESKARHDLSQALFNLRRAIGDHEADPPFLIINRSAIQFNQQSDYQLDVKTFLDLLAACDQHTHPQLAGCESCLTQLQQAVTLYQSHFLDGFSLGDSPEFESWALLERERLRRLAMEILNHLANSHEQRGDYQQALVYARQQVRLDPLHEPAHRRLMRLYAQVGEWAAVLRQYENCEQTLLAELGVPPSVETTTLLETLKASRVTPANLAPKLPPFLEPDTRSHQKEQVFVAREQALDQLDGWLESALAGQGRVTFVTGEAGTGKTALITEFARQVHQRHTDLIVAWGNSNAQTGIGDPYLPFREILAWLTGDVETLWAAGMMSRAQAVRLWRLLPLTAQALLDNGPDLVDVFVRGPSLLTRVAAAVPVGTEWLSRLDELVKRHQTGAGLSNLKQSDLFEQYTDVLQTLARKQPLLLVLDDLQWADAGSISLLFHLARRLAGSRILIVGAYRPVEVALGRSTTGSGAVERHPLEPVVHELQRHFGELAIPLDQAEGQPFVEALLDHEPNRLTAEFRETFYRQTQGHPLFSIELLRAMRAQGGLIRDTTGRWLTGESLDWEILPARVEAVIAERIRRLPAALQQVLKIASIEGETFTAEVLARVQQTDEWAMGLQLSRVLEKEHHLIRTQGVDRLGSQRLSTFRFHHILFQAYVYNTLGDVERSFLHEKVAVALEGLYGDQAGEIAVQLARHFQEARITDKAIFYLVQASEQAARLPAYEEAVVHLTTGLTLVESLPETPDRAKQELKLLIILGAVLSDLKGGSASEVGQVYDRARVLCRHVGETPELFQVVYGLWSYYSLWADWQTALELAEQSLHLARQQGDVTSLILAYRALGVTLIYLADYTSAITHFDEGFALYQANQTHVRSSTPGANALISCLGFKAMGLCNLGYPDQALAQARETLAMAEETSHAFSLSFAHMVLSQVYYYRLEIDAFQAQVRRLIDLAAEHNIGHHIVLGSMWQGWLKAKAGETKAGIAQIRTSLAAFQKMEARHAIPMVLILLAEAYSEAGQPQAGIAVVEEALNLIGQTKMALYQPHLIWLKGVLLTQSQAEAEAETCFQQALEIAGQQGAKLWALRAAVSLGKLRQDQGQLQQTRQRLREVYAWFTEGFDLADLQEAHALLKQLDVE